MAGDSRVRLQPFFKYAGGKTWLREHMAPYMPKTLRMYVEPFVGGGAMLAHVLEMLDAGEMRLLEGGALYVNDVNAVLIECYKQLRADAQALFDTFQSLATQHNIASQGERKALYLSVRASYNEATTRRAPIDLIQCSRFLFLAYAGYRGLCRENKSGKYNTPAGEGKAIQVTSGAFVAFGTALARYPVHFSAITAQQLMRTTIKPEDLGPDDIVLLDPPFEMAGGTGFVDYAHTSWSHIDFIFLRVTCNALRARGVRTFVCNNRVHRVVDLFERPSALWHTVVVKDQTGGMQAGRASRAEVVYCNVPPVQCSTTQ